MCNAKPVFFMLSGIKQVISKNELFYFKLKFATEKHPTTDRYTILSDSLYLKKYIVFKNDAF